jgi:hypothetical protein
MSSSGIRRVAFVKIDISEERVTLKMEVIRSSETLVLTRATQRNIPEHYIHHGDRRENLTSYIALSG